MPELTGSARPESGSTRREFLGLVTKTGVGLAVAGGAVPALLTFGQASAAASDTTTVLVNATVVDATGAPPLRDTTVVVTGDRIAQVGPFSQVVAPAGAQMVDASGKWVIPGLWDLHAHTPVELAQVYAPLYLANGVTGIRELGGLASHYPLRDQIASGALPGPRMLIASAISDGPHALAPAGAIAVGDQAEAREAVRRAKREGADFITTQSFLRAETLEAILDEARQQGIAVVGPTGERSSVVEASSVDPASPLAWFSAWMRMAGDLDRGSAAAAADRAAELVATGGWRSPTLPVLRALISPAEDLANDPRLQYLPKATREQWQQRVEPWAAKTPQQVARQREFFQAELRLVGAMRAAGVSFVGGTDCANPYSFPGFSSHDTLELLVQAGLTPLQALQSATRDAAGYLGLERTSGTVTPGKSADLLVLDADPLDRIANTQRIHAVVARGRFIPQAQRDRLLADAATAANRVPALAAR